MVQQTENISQPSRKIRILWAIVIVTLNVMILSGILFAGLWPFNFLQVNGCEVDVTTRTLVFEKTGIAYRKLDISAGQSLFNDCPFSLAFNVQPFNFPVHCATILAFYNREGKILTVNQWKTKLIVQSGTKRVVFGKVMKEKSPVSVMMTIADSVLTVTCNGITRSALIDCSDMKNRMVQYMVFGNNASLHSSWKGVLTSIRFNKCNDSFNLIQVPRHLVPLKAKMLTPPWNDVRMERRYAVDLVANLIGFIPLGLSLCFLLNIVFSIHNYRYMVIMTSFLISLFIETAQAYLITRTSQMSDLLLNSWGGVLGLVMYIILKGVILDSKKIKNHRSQEVH